MTTTLLRTLTLAAAVAATLPSLAGAQAPGAPLKIGMIMDMSGAYADITGPGSVAAARMAVEDFGGSVLGRKIEVLVADHQNKADVAANVARQWFDVEGAEAIMDVTSSAPALAVLNVAKEKNKVASFSGPGVDRITGDLCMASSVHYVYDTYALANTVARALMKRGDDTWFFLTSDYAFGHSLQSEATKVVTGMGGKVLGAVKHAAAGASPDYSSYILQAQGSKAKVIALANAGSETVNSVNSAHEFGLTGAGGQTLAGLLMYITDVHAIGLQKAGGMLLSEAFYWDMNEDTRAFSKRFFASQKRMPNMSQAGAYSSVTHYLNAVKAAGTSDTAAVMAKMRELPINDFFVKNGRIREDGRMVHDMYLFQVKTPAESKYAWDYFKLVATVPGNEAFAAPNPACPLVKAGAGAAPKVGS